MSFYIGFHDKVARLPLEGEPFLQMYGGDSKNGSGALHSFLYPLFERLAEDSGNDRSVWGCQAHREETRGFQADASRVAIARRDAARREVHVGTQTAPVPRELYEPPRRDDLLHCIEQFERIAARAEEVNLPVVCFGD